MKEKQSKVYYYDDDEDNENRTPSPSFTPAEKNVKERIINKHKDFYNIE